MSCSEKPEFESFFWNVKFRKEMLLKHFLLKMLKHNYKYNIIITVIIMRKITIITCRHKIINL